MLNLPAITKHTALALPVGFFLLLPVSGFSGAKKAGRNIPAPLTQLDLRMDANIYVGGLHAGVLKLHANLKNGVYQAEVTTHSLGMANYFVKWRGTSMAKGLVKDGMLRPTYHQRNDQSRWGKRSVKLDYGDGYQAPKIELKEHHGKNPYRKRDKVPPAQTINTYDHLSGLLATVLRAGIAGKKTCGSAIPFFDGKRRFDVILEPVGREKLRRSRYSAFHGPAQKCLVRIKRMAGFSHKWMKEKKEALARGAKEDEVIVWFAPFNKGQLELPVKVEASNFLGAAFVHPIRIDIDRKTHIALKR